MHGHIHTSYPLLDWLKPWKAAILTAVAKRCSAEELPPAEPGAPSGNGYPAW